MCYNFPKGKEKVGKWVIFRLLKPSTVYTGTLSLSPHNTPSSLSWDSHFTQAQRGYGDQIPWVGYSPWIQTYICPSPKLSGTFHHSTWPEFLPKEVFIGCYESSTGLGPEDAERHKTDLDLVSKSLHFCKSMDK